MNATNTTKEILRHKKKITRIIRKLNVTTLAKLLIATRNNNTSTIEKYIAPVYNNTNAVVMMNASPRFGQTNNFLSLMSPDKSVVTSYVTGYVSLLSHMFTPHIYYA